MKQKRKAALSVQASGKRNPKRTQERILEAAFAEFAAQGFAGARVDSIARRAAINKRMLYHYFGDKEALFREVLRRKMHQRQPWFNATPDDPRDSMPYWLELACKDVNWIRLMEWEALQFGEGRLIDEKRRARASSDAVKRISHRQSLGHLSRELDAKRILLAMVALTWFPIAFPQLTKLITGQTASNPRFLQEQQEFLRRLADAFRPKQPFVKLKGSPQANGRAGNRVQ